MILARIRPGCQDCTPDGSGTDIVLKDSQIALMHQAFEKAFCTKLQNSGLTNFVNIHDCSFRFVYNPVGAISLFLLLLADSSRLSLWSSVVGHAGRFSLFYIFGVDIECGYLFLSFKFQQSVQ
jgi:hypothetical protein